MNVDRGQTSFTDEEIAALRERLVDYKATLSLSWDGLSKRTGVPAGTLQPWTKGNYAGDNARVAAQINKFFLAEREREQLELQAPIVPGFHMTKTARRIHAQLRWAQRGKITVIVGTAGVGKTAAIKQFQSSTPNVVLSTMSRHARAPSAMLFEIMSSAHGRLSRSFGGNLQAHFHSACDFFDGRQALIVVDEAQHLLEESLEQLRALHDAVGVGVALAGNRTVLARVHGGAQAAAYAQLDSRISVVGVYDKPDAEDVAVLLSAWGITHPLERQFLERLAAQPGCLRTLTQVLELATLTAQQGEEERSLEHIKYAWQARPRQGLAA